MCQWHVGAQWCFIQHLEETAYFIDKARVEGQSVLLTLADGSMETLDLTTLSTRGPEDVYCRLPERGVARFLRDALAALAPWLDEEEEQFGLRLGDRFYPIRAE